MAENATNLAGAQFVLNYESDKLTFVDAQVGQGFIGADCVDDFDTGTESVSLGVACNLGKSGSSLVLWTVTFDALDVSEATQTELLVTDVKLGNGDAPPSAILARGESATVTIAIFECGDLTGDFDVDILDVIASLQIVVEMIDPSPTQQILGDLNGTDDIDIGDSATTLSHAIAKTIPTACGPMDNPTSGGGGSPPPAPTPTPIFFLTPPIFFPTLTPTPTPPILIPTPTPTPSV